MTIIHISVNYSEAKNVQFSKQGGPCDLLCFCVFVFVMLMQDLLLHEAEKIICFHGNNGSIGPKKHRFHGRGRQCVTSERWMGKAVYVARGGGGQPHRKFSLSSPGREQHFFPSAEKAQCERGGEIARDGRREEEKRMCDPYQCHLPRLTTNCFSPSLSHPHPPRLFRYALTTAYLSLSLPSSLLSPGYSRRSTLAVSGAKPEKWICINLTNCFWVRSISPAACSTYSMFISSSLHAIVEWTKRILTISNIKSIAHSTFKKSY